jgi:preprotein translocase subunit SecE
LPKAKIESRQRRGGYKGQSGMIAKIQKFIGEVLAEMKKVSWTTRRELVDSTLIVILSSFILGIFVGIIDFAFSKGVAVIIK